MKYNPKRIEKELDQITLSAMSLEIQARQCERRAEKERKLCYRCTNKGDMEGAKVAAECSIREKNNILMYRRLAAKNRGMQQRVETAVRMQTMTHEMGKLVKNMGYLCKLNDTEKMTETISKFEAQFENIDVDQKYMEGAV
jgi:charged multivesicular body protein 1